MLDMLERVNGRLRLTADDLKANPNISYTMDFLRIYKTS